MKYILGIQTAEHPNSIAIISSKNKVVCSHSFEDKFQTIEQLKRILEELMAEAKINPKDIFLVSVCIGPGSYTGLRGGLAFGKGFCQFSQIPLVGVTLFDAAKEKNWTKKDSEYLFDAKNGRVFYKRRDNILVGGIDDVLDSFGGIIRFCGSGAVAYSDQIRAVDPTFRLCPEDMSVVSAADVASCGSKVLKKDSSRFKGHYLYKVKPLYILPPNITKGKK